MASQPEPPDRPERMAFERTGGYGSRLPWGIVVVLTLVIIAIIKPWSFGQALSEGSPPPAAPAVAEATGPPTPTPEPTLAPGALACSNYDAWRAVTIEHTLDQEVHRWIAIDPAAAQDALDPAIPTVRVVAGRLDAIGYCAPETVTVADPPHVFRVVDGVTTMVDETSALRLMVPTGHHAARIFQPPQGTDTWSPGRYVVEVRLGHVPEGGPGVPSSAWFAIDVEHAASDPVQADGRSLFSPPPSP